VENLWPPNSRPTIVVDPAANAVADPSRVIVGRPRALGRERLLYALPLDPGPALLRPATVLRDPGAAVVGDPVPVIVGREALWVSRMLVALPAEDTRGLGGGGAA
jgi:hypothetical protein